MYNRYIRNDQGVYTRIPEEEPRRPQAPPPPPGGPEPPHTGDGPGAGASHAPPGGGQITPAAYFSAQARTPWAGRTPR